MIGQIYVERLGRKFGPYSATQLRALARAGKLHPTDTVWKEGMEKAVPAAEVKNLFPLTQSALRPLAAAVAESTEAASTPASADEPSLSYLDGSALTVFAQAPSKEPLETAAALAIASCPPIPSPAAQPPEHNAGPTAKPPVRPAEKTRMRRAVGVTGAVLVGQDGYSVQYRKKCSQCGFEDNCRSSMLISTGITRSHFFCPKCRKSREVQIQGTMQ